jgi:predicted transcriptional regulator
MKKRVSITLSSRVLSRVDKLAESKRARSVVIERAIRNESRQHSTSVNEIAELERINNAADQLNAEVTDVLEYQRSSSDRNVNRIRQAYGPSGKQRI